MSARIAAIKSELCAMLQVSEEKLFARIAGMRIAPVCSRCGGCGQHSYCESHGSRCFGCGGTGTAKPGSVGEWEAVHAAAMRAVESGAFAEYMKARAMKLFNPETLAKAESELASMIAKLDAMGVKTEECLRAAYPKASDSMIAKVLDNHIKARLEMMAKIEKKRAHVALIQAEME